MDLPIFLLPKDEETITRSLLTMKKSNKICGKQCKARNTIVRALGMLEFSNILPLFVNHDLYPLNDDL